MTNFHSLDFTLLRKPESMGLLIRLPHDIEDELRTRSALSEIYDRARAALHFLVKGVDDEHWRVEAYLRAGLNEFYSLEDAANRAFRAHSRGTKAPGITESQHPLLHAMYGLRHVNVHVKPTATRRETLPAPYQSSPSSHRYSIGVNLLEDDTGSALLSTLEVKRYYAPGDMQRTMSWLLESQAAFGVGAVLRLGLEQYCRDLLAALPPRK